MPSQASKTLNFGPWQPDLASTGSNAEIIIGAVVRADGYGPFKSFEAFTAALPAGNRGFFFARRGDGSIAVFAGTSTDLYLLNNGTFEWDNVSKGGVPYSPLVSTSNWQFAQFNDLVITVQVNTAPQKYTLASGGTFVDLLGSPPAAAFVSIVGFFVVLTGLLSNPRRVQWSDLGAPETWTAGVGLADFQDLSDGGNVSNLSGGDAFGVIFQQESIRTITYAPGASTVFQISRISTQETLYAEYSIINVGNRTFYLGASGFRMIVGSGSPEPIGKEQVDRTFFEDVDKGNLQLVIGASDPTSTRVYWAYKSQQGQAGLFDTVLAYDYMLGAKGGGWTKLMISGTFLASLAKPGLTLEQLDAIAPGALTVLGAANNGAGLIRLTLDATSSPEYDIAGQNFIVVQGITPSYMNGTWVVNIIDATHIDLVGSTFAAAYVSGGKIGGSLDALPFSLDSISKSSAAELAMFDENNKLGFFTGPNLEALLETPDGDPVGNTVEINGARPMTDCATGYVSIGTRLSTADPTVYDPEYQMDDQGWCEAYSETRYARGRLRCPAGATWTYATGIQPDVAVAGEA